jgi:PAS domain S-box-containing protein
MTQFVTPPLTSADAPPSGEMAVLLDRLAEGVVLLDTHFAITWANLRASLLLGRPASELAGLDFPTICPGDRAGIAFRLCAQVLESGGTATFDARQPGADTAMEAQVFPAPGGLSIHLRPQPAPSRAESDWHRDTERFEFVMQATSDVIWDWNLATRDLYINPSFTRILGYALGEDAMPHQLWYEHLHPADKDRVINNQLQALRDPAVTYWEDTYAFYRANGTMAILRDRAIIMRDEDGKALRMIGAAQDITRQREAEQRIERNERRFRAMVQSGLDVVLLLDRNFSIQYISPNAFLLSGYTPDDLQGLLALDPIHPEDVAAIFSNGLQLLTRKKVVLPLFRYLMKDGTYRWMEATLTNHLDDSSIGAIIVNVRDITERKESEEAVRLSEERYKLLFYQSPVPKWIYRHEDMRFVDVNDAALLHYGYSRDEFLAMTVLDIRPARETARFQNLAARLGDQKERRNSAAWKHVKKNGQEIDVEVTTHGLDLPSGFHIIAEATDVTQKMELEQRLIEEKVTAQKEIAKAIINTQEKERSEIGKELHDNVNQLLTTTKLYIENIRYFPAQQDTFIDKSAALVQRAITEIRSLSRALVTPTIYDIGFKATLDELIEHYLSLEVFDIQFLFDAEEERIDRGMKLTIYRILQELLNNIVKYAGAKSVAIAIRQDDCRLNVSVSDDGAGFDPCLVRVGLGLNNIKNRAEVFKGIVKIQAAPGAGCTVAISFPC